MRSVRCVALSVLVTASHALPALAGCGPELNSLSRAAQQSDLMLLESSFEGIDSSPECSGAEKSEAKRLAGAAYVRVALQRVAEGARLADQESLLLRATSFGKVWQADAMLGDIHLDRKDYSAATISFQKALDLLNDHTLTKGEPDPEVVLSVFKKASEARQLAPLYVPPTVVRGEPAGLASDHFRGIGHVAVPVPVTFETDSTDFTDKGRDAAADMARYLKKKKMSRVVLVGHTDERGSPTYNQALSERRAHALARFLSEQGIDIPIEASGMGESSPYLPDNPARYSQEETWQLNRRVELDWR